MTTESTPPRVEPPDANAGREAIERDIEQTRADLGRTVDALVAKADVKQRGKQKLRALRQSAEDNPRLTAAVAGAVVAAALTAGVLLWRRSR